MATSLSVAFFVQAIVSSQSESLTWDEPSYIVTGYLQLTRGDYRFNTSHPPLTQQLFALPLLFLDLEAPDDADLDAALETGNPVVWLGRQFLFEKGNDPIAMAFWARMPAHLAGSALVLMVFLWGRRLIGVVPALLSTALAAASPNLAAHAKLATEDMMCTAFMFGAVWAFATALQKGGLRQGALAGGITGLALMSKYTALLLLPVYGMIWLACGLRERSWRLAPGPLTVGVLLALLVIAFGCRFDLSIYWNGISTIYEDLRQGYTYYFWGRVSPDPFWYHTLASFVLKEPLSTLFLLTMALAVCLRQRPSLEIAAVVAIPAAIIVGVSLFDRFNFGLRRILPALPFLFLIAGFAIRRGSTRRGWLVLVSVACLALEVVWIYPHHLSYLNALAGGSSRGAHVFDDSNVDWGQDLPALALWQRRHEDARPIRLSYFGTADPKAYGVRAAPIPWDDFLAPKSGYYAVSAHQLVWLRKMKSKKGTDVDWLGKYRPVDRAAFSIYIFRFPESFE